MCSEQLYKAMADRLAADGYRDAGYVYVNIDDCWSAKERDPVTNRLLPDPKRFPSGMKALADYVRYLITFLILLKKLLQFILTLIQIIHLNIKRMKSF